MITRWLSMRKNLRAFSEFFLSFPCHPFLCPLLLSLPNVLCLMSHNSALSPMSPVLRLCTLSPVLFPLSHVSVPFLLSPVPSLTSLFLASRPLSPVLRPCSLSPFLCPLSHISNPCLPSRDLSSFFCSLYPVLRLCSLSPVPCPQSYVSVPCVPSSVPRLASMFLVSCPLSPAL